MRKRRDNKMVPWSISLEFSFLLLLQKESDFSSSFTLGLEMSEHSHCCPLFGLYIHVKENDFY